MLLPPEVGWPIGVDEADPYAGDELWSPVSSDPRHAELEALLLRAVRSGEPADYERAAAEIRADELHVEKFWDKRPLGEAPLLPTDMWFADISENWVPDIGVIAPDRVFGPLADRELSRRERVVAAGVMAFSIVIPPDARPVDRWERDRYRDPRRERLTVRTVFRSPAMLWSVRDGRWRPRLPVVERFVPDDCVQMLPLEMGADPALVEDGDWVARVFRVESKGWYAALAVPAPHDVSVDSLLRCLRLAWWRLRLRLPAATWEDALRFRSEILYRFCAEHRWLGEEKHICDG
jgi:hypothetical protein